MEAVLTCGLFAMAGAIAQLISFKFSMKMEPPFSSCMLVAFGIVSVSEMNYQLYLGALPYIRGWRNEK